MDMAQTPPQGMPAEAPAQGGMTICINVAPDGSITVAKEAYEAAEGTGQPAQGIGDALKQALDRIGLVEPADDQPQSAAATSSMPKINARGIVRCGSRTSPAMSLT